MLGTLMTTTMPPTRVRNRIAASVGHLTLDRPDALNALDIERVGLIRNALEQGRDDDDVAFVVIDSSSARAFCAGGDIRQVWSSVRAGRTADAWEFLAREYALNRCMAEYPKTIVSLTDGDCFGGGMGLGSPRQVAGRDRAGSVVDARDGDRFRSRRGRQFLPPQLPGKRGRNEGVRAGLLDQDQNPRWSEGRALAADLERVRSVLAVHRPPGRPRTAASGADLTRPKDGSMFS
jgi:enoyl-CoA hydratase